MRPCPGEALLWQAGPAPSHTFPLAGSLAGALALAPPASRVCRSKLRAGTTLSLCSLRCIPGLPAGEVGDGQGCSAGPCWLRDPALRPVGLKPVPLLVPPTLHRGTSAFPKCSGMFQDAFPEAWLPSGVVSALKVPGPSRHRAGAAGSLLVGLGLQQPGGLAH